MSLLVFECILLLNNFFSASFARIFLEYFSEMISKLFGGPKVSFDSLMKNVDVPDPAIIEYFKRETEKLKRRNKLAASVSFSTCAFQRVILVFFRLKFRNLDFVSILDFFNDIYRFLPIKGKEISN